MGRRGGVGILMAVARDVARQQRMAEAARVRAIREAERQERATQREAARYKRECSNVEGDGARSRTRYREAREQETALLNEDIQDTLTALDRILSNTFSVDDTISFAGLRILDAPPSFAPPEHPQTSTRSSSGGDLSSWRARSRWNQSLYAGCEEAIRQRGHGGMEELRSRSGRMAEAGSTAH